MECLLRFEEWYGSGYDKNHTWMTTNKSQHVLQLLAETVQWETHDLTLHQRNNAYIVVAAANARNQAAADALNAVASRFVHGFLRVHVRYVKREGKHYPESAPERAPPSPPRFAP